MIRGVWWCMVILLTMQSCGNKVIETPTGISVEFLREGDGELPDFDDVLHFDLRYKDHTGKIMYDSKSRNSPYKIRNLDLLRDTTSIYGEIFRFCRVGDSITFKVPYTRFYPAIFNQACPDQLRNEFATYHASLFLALNLDEIQQRRKDIYDEETAQINFEDSLHRIKQSKIDSAILIQYLSEKGIETVRRPDGVHVKMIEEGTGRVVKHGNTVTVDFVGTLLDGREFNNSYKTKDPLAFVIGFREVILGWDDVLKGMTMGTKVTLYIPSTMAYGNKASGPMVEPNTILVYDIEIVDVR